METRRKQEELERLRLEEEDRRAALLLQAQLEKEAQEDTKYRQLMEQERRDHELALRLAQESNGQIEESPQMSRKYVEEFLKFQVFVKKIFLLKQHRKVQSCDDFLIVNTKFSSSISKRPRKFL